MHVALAVGEGGANPGERAIAHIPRYLVAGTLEGSAGAFFVHRTWENAHAAIRHRGGIMGRMLLRFPPFFIAARLC